MNHKTLCISIYLFALISTSHSSDRYFLCGPDEDGCFEDMYESCLCIPYNDIEAEHPYCLDFDVLKCTPLSQTPHCEPMFVFNNQSECLATIFQSEPTPPCTITTHAFCLKEHLAICDANGQLDSCVK
ncbi:MAG: hypothetical protein NTW94_03070 [Legionellales bacterium]|nr:hypothetical protein [Legionellales bacterium]